MKKIILAVASVLALGMMVSCKQEISGEIDVNNHSKDITQYKYYYYTAEGGFTETNTSVGTSKAAGASATTTGTSVTTTTGTVKAGGIQVEEINYYYNNTTTYTYTIPYTYKQTNVYTPYGGTAGNTNVWANNASANYVFTVKKTDGKCYIQDLNGNWVIYKDFNPTADVIDFSKVPYTSSETTTYTNPTYTTAGALDSYSLTTTTKTVSNTIKLTKVK